MTFTARRHFCSSRSSSAAPRKCISSPGPSRTSHRTASSIPSSRVSLARASNNSNSSNSRPQEAPFQPRLLAASHRTPRAPSPPPPRSRLHLHPSTPPPPPSVTTAQVPEEECRPPTEVGWDSAALPPRVNPKTPLEEANQRNQQYTIYLYYSSISCQPALMQTIIIAPGLSEQSKAWQFYVCSLVVVAHCLHCLVFFYCVLKFRYVYPGTEGNVSLN